MLNTFEPLGLLHSEDTVIAAQVLVANLHGTPKLPATKLVDFDELTLEPTRPLLVRGRRKAVRSYRKLGVCLPRRVRMGVWSLAVHGGEEPWAGSSEGSEVLAWTA